MKVITCHLNTDFDAFSSMVAAHKLHPDALMVFPGLVSKEVKHFLILYKELFDIKKIEDINLDEVTELIIVDTNSVSRIGAFKDIVSKPNVYTYVYDHHPTVDTMINANISNIETVGANTTIMVNEIIKRNIKIDSIEATILALGIYFDTNCLTFSATTSKDAYALAYLLEKGAKLNVINSYMEHRLTKEQEDLYLKLTNLVEMIEIDKVYIGISKLDIKEYVSDVAFITRKILETRGYDAMFCVIKMGNKIYIVGRSKNDAINVGDIMRKLGGAGHPRAASATIKNKNLEEYYSILLEVIRKSVKPNIRAKDIMTTPVKTLSNNAKIDEANLMISRYGHTGLPIVDNGKLVGIITRRDIEKALIHKYGNSPVKAYMSKNIITIDKNKTVEEVENIFIENNIGRVPVVEDGKLLGIITRTDILNVIHGKDNIVSHKSLYNLKTGNNDNKENAEENIIEKIFSLDENVRNILLKAGQLGDELNKNIYVVGGFVRDLILNLENNDIDIVVEGDGISFANELANRLKAKLTTHDLFKTALIETPDLNIDVVTARAEYYRYPAALPTVREGSIKDDLFRRDFTINSMAIHLNSNNFGDLVDYFGGLKDLEDKKIRILHNLSFIDDPTRIFRAIKFEQRYKFKMEEETEKFALKAVKDEVIGKLSKERIWFEIEFMMNEKNVFGSLTRLYKLGLFEMIFNVSLESYKADFVEHFEKIKKQYVNKYNFINVEKSMLIYTVLYSNLSFDYFNSIKDTIKISKKIILNIENYISNFDDINDFFKNGNINDKYSIYKKLNHITDANLAILLYVFEKDDIISNTIKDYILNMRQIKLEITGKDVLDLGTTPGPHLKEILEEVLKSKINGEVTNKEEEIYLASKLVIANKGFAKVLN